MFLLKTDIDYNHLQFSLALDPKGSLMDSTCTRIQSSKAPKRMKK